MKGKFESWSFNCSTCKSKIEEEKKNKNKKKSKLNVKQYNEGARYVRHMDASPNHAGQRRITVLLYLNQNW